MLRKKRKRPNNTDDPFNISFELDRRSYYRVQPSPEAPVFFKVRGKRFSVLDVSAGGLAYRGQGNEVPGRQVAGVLKLPDPWGPVPLILSILKRTQEGIVAGRIVKIKEKDRETIHLYVLDCQKKEIEKRRRQRAMPASQVKPPQEQN